MTSAPFVQGTGFWIRSFILVQSFSDKPRLNVRPGTSVDGRNLI